jgi:hypothetical protein
MGFRGNFSVGFWGWVLWLKTRFLGGEMDLVDRVVEERRARAEEVRVF